MNTERNSSFELLRLFCIFGIVAMHAFGGIDTSSSLLNTEAHILFNSLFNTGVTCFILISGYFGIRFRLEKLIRLDLMIIFFTLCGTLLLGGFGLKELIKSCIPVLSRQHWFITCYFALCILAPFLNEIPERLERAKFRSLLLVLLLLLSLIPTLTTYDIMQDAGKGLADFVMVYLIGRYLALYRTETYCTRALLAGFFSCILFIFVSDSALTFLHGGVLYSTFSRDCSAFIILAAVLLLLFFRELHFTSRAVNRLARNVLAVTVLDRTLQTFFGRFFRLDAYGESALLPLLVLAYALAVMAGAILLNEVRTFTIGRIDAPLSEALARLWYRLQEHGVRLIRTLLATLIRPKP